MLHALDRIMQSRILFIGSRPFYASITGDEDDASPPTTIESERSIVIMEGTDAIAGRRLPLKKALLETVTIQHVI